MIEAESDNRRHQKMCDVRSNLQSSRSNCGASSNLLDTIVAECGKENMTGMSIIYRSDPEMYDDMVAFITPEVMKKLVLTDDKQTSERSKYPK